MEVLLSEHNLSETKPDNQIGYWEARLASEKVIFENHGGQLSAWLRLSEYLEKSGDHITGLTLRLNNRTTNIPSGSQAYFFARKMIASMGGPSVIFFGVGHQIKEDVVRIVWACQNGLSNSEERSFKKCGKGLIRKQTNGSI